MRPALSPVMALALAAVAGAADSDCPVDTLTAKLSQATSENRLQAALALAACGDSRAEPALLEALAATDEENRRPLLRYLGRIGTAASVAPLTEILARDGAQFDVLEALARIDPEWRSHVDLERLAERLAADAVLPQTDETVEGETLANEDRRRKQAERCWPVRRRLELLSSIAPDRAAGLAVGLLEGGGASTCLSNLLFATVTDRREVAAIPVLLQYLSSPSQAPYDGDQAVAALDAIDADWRESAAAKQAGTDILRRIDSDDGRTRHAAMYALRWFPATGAVPALTRAISDRGREDSERLVAIDALAAIGDDGARRALLRCASEGDMRSACSQALAHEPDETAVPSLVAALRQNDSDASSREEALEALQFVIKKASRADGEGADQRSATVAALSAGNVSEITRALVDLLKDDSLQWRAASLLAKLRTPEALVALRKAFDDSAEVADGSLDFEVAANALLTAGGQDELPRVMATLRDEPAWTVEVLGILLGHDWVPVSVISGLVDDVIAARTQASATKGPSSERTLSEIDWALERVADRLARDPDDARIGQLRWLAQHPEPGIRARARYALYRVGAALDEPAGASPAK